MQHRQKNKALLLAKGCWDLSMGLRTRAKELMGLLEAQTVVSARAKLAGSTATQREVEAALWRKAAGDRTLTTTQVPHFSPVRKPELRHPLWAKGCRAQWLHEERVCYSKRKPLRQVLLQDAHGPYIKRR